MHSCFFSCISLTSDTSARYNATTWRADSLFCKSLSNRLACKLVIFAPRLVLPAAFSCLPVTSGVAGAAEVSMPVSRKIRRRNSLFLITLLCFSTVLFLFLLKLLCCMLLQLPPCWLYLFLASQRVFVWVPLLAPFWLALCRLIITKCTQPESFGM